MRGFGIIKPMVEVGWLDKEKPVVDEYGAILEPVVVAPCTSDVHNAFEMGDNPGSYNRILGHEVVGRILEVGTGVKDFKAGDVVLVPAVTPDWRCPNIQDEPHQHAGHLMGGLRLSSAFDGAMAECFFIPDADLNLAVIPDNVSLDSAVMVGDMMTTGFHGAEMAEIKYGDDVLVIGIGPVGLMAVAGAALRGAANIYAVGSRPGCVEIANKYGATETINYKEGAISDQVLQLTHGRGVDAVVVAGGDNDSIETAFMSTRPGGVISNVNVLADPKGINLSLWSTGFGMSHKKYIGGMCPGGRRRMERLLAMISAERVDPSLIISHRFHGFEEFPNAFELMVKKPADLIKPVVYVNK